MIVIKRNKITFILTLFVILNILLLKSTEAIPKKYLFEQPCLGYKCKDCNKEIYRFNSKSFDQEFLNIWNIGLQQTNGLVSIREVMIQEGAIPTLPVIDELIFESISDLLNTRYFHTIENDFHETPIITPVNLIKTKLEEHPLMIDESKQSKLNSIYSKNGL